MICLPKIYLSWKMRVWVTQTFSRFSYGAASCWLQVTCSFSHPSPPTSHIKSLDDLKCSHVAFWEWWGGQWAEKGFEDGRSFLLLNSVRMGGEWDRAELLLEAVLPYTSYGQVHFSLFSGLSPQAILFPLLRPQKLFCGATSQVEL